MAKKEAGKLPHIFLKDTAHTEPYTSTRSGRQLIKLPPRIRQEHGNKLLRRFEQLRLEADRLIKEQKAYGIDVGNGIYVQFESDPNFELKF